MAACGWRSLKQGSTWRLCSNYSRIVWANGFGPCVLLLHSFQYWLGGLAELRAQESMAAKSAIIIFATENCAHASVSPSHSGSVSCSLCSKSKESQVGRCFLFVWCGETWYLGLVRRNITIDTQIYLKHECKLLFDWLPGLLVGWPAWLAQLTRCIAGWKAWLTRKTFQNWLDV